jgi:hypothetical protein
LAVRSAKRTCGVRNRKATTCACFAAELVLEQLVEVVVPPNQPSGGEAEVLGTGVEEGGKPARVLPLRRCIELSYESQEGDRIQGID